MILVFFSVASNPACDLFVFQKDLFSLNESFVNQLSYYLLEGMACLAHHIFTLLTSAVRCGCWNIDVLSIFIVYPE